MIASWSTGSLYVEYRLAHWVYYNIPALQLPKQPHSGTLQSLSPSHSADHSCTDVKGENGPSDITVVPMMAVGHAAAEDEEDSTSIPLQDRSSPMDIAGSVDAVTDAHRSVTPVGLSLLPSQSPPVADTPDVHPVALPFRTRFVSAVLHTLRSWSEYRHHPVFAASLSYCLLYVSVLNFGGQMTAYLKIYGLSDALLAGGRAIAVTFACCSLQPTLLSLLLTLGCVLPPSAGCGWDRGHRRFAVYGS